ncbi:MAG: hypothetical protein A2X36_04895 [Elusimicrobia bacterium GWA2_69_24]|nr:MAG: hypothetical protein A2X36_04895 [Elusimicrobia bacterium GWA2_69_24]
MDRSLGPLLEKLHFSEASPKMAFIVGPRQCGKTYLARMLQSRRGSPGLYRNWDDLGFRREISRSPYGFLDEYRPSGPRPLAVLDEIHKFPKWKTYLKGLWDTRADRADVLVTGSGRLDVYQRGGDSMLGRYHAYRLHPLSLSELCGRSFDPDQDTPPAILDRLMAGTPAVLAEEREGFDRLMRFGGFPEPFLGQSERKHRLWLRERRERLVREDLRDLTRVHLLSSVEQMMELLPLRAGSRLSMNSLREDLGVSLESVRLWMDQFERLYICHRVRPYAGRLQRSLRREPKLFLHDWSEAGDPGARFENMLACALLRWCHFTQDWGQEELGLHYVRDKEKREVDFLLTLGKKPWLLIEAKLSGAAPSNHLGYFASRLPGVRTLLVCAEAPAPGSAGGVRVLPAATFLSHIP